MNKINYPFKIIKYQLLIIIFYFLLIGYSNSLENKIEFKVNNEIITTIDINKEIKLLTSLNPKLLELDKRKILKVSTDSLIKEKIKKIEIKKFKKEIKIDDKYLSKIIENTYKKINLSSEEEFINFLKNKNLKFEEFKTKLTIETLWNEIIFVKFRSKVKIDKNKIKLELNKLNNEDFKTYDLSEILFNVNENENLDEKYQLIVNEIRKKGFENAALINSISSSAKLGGKLGWVEETALNENLNKIVSELNINEFSNPYVIPGGFLILKLNNVKKTKKKINIEKELKKIVNIRSNEQLNQFSNIYFNKIKKNIKIEKL